MWFSVNNNIEPSRIQAKLSIGNTSSLTISCDDPRLNGAKLVLRARRRSVSICIELDRLFQEFIAQGVKFCRRFSISRIFPYGLGQAEALLRFINKILWINGLHCDDLSA
jgi:hypothetical protein